MWYLFGQVWLLLLVAFFLGWFSHWFFCCRNKDESGKTGETVSNTATPLSTVASAAPIHDDWKPQGFSARPDKVDDLKRIKGIGSVIEETLNSLGVYQFSQVSEWNSDNINWVENFIAFPGRIAREDWINQAKTLESGGTTEFAQRVDKGDLDY